MKNIFLKYHLLLAGVLFFATTVFSQQQPKEWDLRTCINYALQNNIQIKKQQQTVEINKVNSEQSKAERLPNLNASVGQSFINQKETVAGSNAQQQSASGNYSIRSDMVLYNGLKIDNTIKQPGIADKVVQQFTGIRTGD